MPEPQPLVIGGEQVATRETFAAVDPSTGREWARLAKARASDVDAAVEAARLAFRTWRRSTPAERQEALWKIADRIEERREAWPPLLATENGRAVREAITGDVPTAAAIYRYFSGLTRTSHGERVDVGDSASHVYTVREPLGPIAALIPWNSPLITTANKLAPALAAGNTVVLKPSEYAATSVVIFVRELADILPAGVVNVVTGFGPATGAALVGHTDVAKVSFTGGAETARRILEAAAAKLTPSLMELGGKSAFIICPDADLEAAAADAALGIFMANGEVCFAASRLLVHDDIYDTFVERLVATTESIRVGDAVDLETQLGPLVTSSHRERVLAHIERARREGARVLTGGRLQVVDGELADGYFIAPTVLVDEKSATSVVREEIFGPVVVVERWHDEAEAVDRANATRYGLAAGVWTLDIGRAHRIAAELEAGIVWVNKWFDVPPGMPMGGVKQSGFGRETPAEALLEYSASKAVNVGLGRGRLALWG